MSLARRARGQTGLRRRRETLTRDGLWRLRGAIRAGGDLRRGMVRLARPLTRTSPEATLAPDTDGLLGGRYRGTLAVGRPLHGRGPTVRAGRGGGGVRPRRGAWTICSRRCRRGARGRGAVARWQRAGARAGCPTAVAGGRVVRRLALRSRSEASSRHRARRHDGHRGAARDRTRRDRWIGIRGGGARCGGRGTSWSRRRSRRVDRCARRCGRGWSRTSCWSRWVIAERSEGSAGACE